jgi:hypothetical protein
LLTSRPTADGTNHSFWYDHPHAFIEHPPFPSFDWHLPVPPERQSYRQIFHQEGCSCPTDSVLIPVPGLSDFQGVYEEAEWVQDSRLHANRIQKCVDKEFNRIFTQAKAAELHCNSAKHFWRVYYYCNLPCNRERTQGGTKVGRLIHPEIYDALNHDFLKWLEPGNYDRPRLISARLIPVIVENCIYRTESLGASGVAPPAVGAWGSPFNPTTFTNQWYI